MTTLAFLLALASDNPNLMPKIIFWILLLLWGVGSFGFRDNVHVVRGTNLVQIILFGILGYYTFSF